MNNHEHPYVWLHLIPTAMAWVEAIERYTDVIALPYCHGCNCSAPSVAMATVLALPSA